MKMTNKEALQVLFGSACSILHHSIGNLEGQSFWAGEDGQRDLELTTARIHAAQRQLEHLIERAEVVLPNMDALIESIVKAINRFANERVTVGEYWPHWRGDSADHTAELLNARELAVEALAEAGVSNVELVRNIVDAITQYSHDRLEMEGYYPSFNFTKEDVPSAQQLAIEAVHKSEALNKEKQHGKES